MPRTFNLFDWVTPGPTPAHRPELGGCWMFTGKSRTGRNREYGQAHYVATGKTTAHRAAWILTYGPISDDLVIDHLCRRPLCIRPDHLEAVSNRTNVLRSEHPNAVAHVTDVCTEGHSDWYVRRNGNRQCRPCNVTRTREWRHAQR